MIRRLIALCMLLNVPVPELEPWRERAREALAEHRQSLEDQLTEEGRLPDDWDNEIEESEQTWGLLSDSDEDFDEDDIDEDDELYDKEDIDEGLDAPGSGYEEVVRPIVHGDPKVGRNDPCPCRSGKKFKNCCMNRQKNPPKIDW